MFHSSNLDFCAEPSLPTGWQAPAWLRIELGIFAGRLYFEYSEYKNLCVYFGIKEAGTKVEEGADDSSDGAVEDLADQPQMAWAALPQLPKAFTKKPLTFLREWLALRRKGHDFTHTPMGYLCQGKPLLESHPFFTKIEDKDVQSKESENMGKEGENGDAGSGEEDSEVEEDLFDGDMDSGDVGGDGEDTFDESQPLDENYENVTTQDAP